MGKPRHLADKSTGNYRIELLEDDSQPFIEVLWTGAWGSGESVSLAPESLDNYLDQHLEDDSKEAIKRCAKEWLKQQVSGDRDVEEMLQLEGYDRFGNLTSSKRHRR